VTGVYSGKYFDQEAVPMAKIFLKFGANINGSKLTATKDAPLAAAAGLPANRFAFLLVENGADEISSAAGQ